MDNDIEVLVLQSKLSQLEEDSRLLECLRNAGVDNWDGYDFALEEFHNG